MAFFAKKPEEEKPRRGCLSWFLRRFVVFGMCLLALVYAAGLLAGHFFSGMPGTGISTVPMRVAPDKIKLIVDRTYHDRDGKKVLDQKIFETWLKLIAAAEDEIVLDMFLINEFKGVGAAPARSISTELVAALVRKLKQQPELFVLFITDPINSVYEESCPEVLRPLVAAGGHVVITDLDQLADSNKLYSPFYRVLKQPLRHSRSLHTRVVGNPFDSGAAEKVALGQLLRLLNFKANHRKNLLVRDDSGQLTAVIASANPHSASSAHGNVAVQVEGGPLPQMLASEYRVAHGSVLAKPKLYFGPWSQPQLVRELERRLTALDLAKPDMETGRHGVLMQYLTEQAIGQKIDAILSGAEDGDRIEVIAFYLSDPEVVAALRQAALRGASVRLLLDPNKDAFGRRKNGIPNRVIAGELVAWAQANPGVDLAVRWFATQGEQAHYKLLRISKPAIGKDQLLLGSANFTIRNLRGSNLEAAVYFEDAEDAGRQVGNFFRDAWENRGGAIYSVDFDTYRLTTVAAKLGQVQVWLGNNLGVCTY